MVAPAAPSPEGPALVGRGREQAQLRDALAAAHTGHGGLVLLGGEAGIGKTALAEWALAEAERHGALVLVGRCYDLSETPPYGPWHEVFDRAPRHAALPTLPAAVLPPGRAGAALASQEAIVARVRAYLAALATARPLVLLLEDLHWADPASLDLLRVVGRDLADLPLLVLVTYRADGLPDDRPLAVLLPHLVREARAARLDLRPLDRSAIGALVAGRYALAPAEAARLADYLAARTEGNPLFLGELLRTLEAEGLLRQDEDRWAVGDLAAAPVPALLRQVIAGRAARLGEGPRRLLALAAAIGQEVPLDLWRAVADAEDEALLATVELGAAAGLLEATADGARFAHALVREALYAGVLPARRRALHRRAAEALLATPRPDPDAVAYHLRQAGDERAVAWLLRAGERAEHADAEATAAERYAAALALLPDDATLARERGWLRYRLALFHWLDAPHRSIDELEALGPLATAAGDPYLAAYAGYLLGMYRCTVGDYRRGLPEMRAGVARLGALPAVERITLATLGDFVVVPRIYDELNPAGALVNHLAGAGHLAEALALGEANAAAPVPADASPMRRAAAGDTHQGLGQAYAFLGRPDEAGVAFARAREANRATNELRQIANAYALELAWVLLPYLADRAPERRRLLAEQAAQGEALERALGPRPFPRLARLGVALLEGRWGEVRAQAGAARAARGAAGGAIAGAVGRLARAQGDAALAWAIIGERVPDGPDAPPGEGRLGQTLVLQQLAAGLALDAGHLPAARAWLAAHDRWLAWSGSVLYRAEGQLGWAVYHRAAGDDICAREHAARALALATTPRQPPALLAAHRTLGELVAAAGRHAEAAQHLAAALTLADACAAPYERALTLLALAELRAATNDRDAATMALDEACAICEPLGALPALARAAALAARLADLPAVPTAPFGLTGREAEVLRLLAEGLPDAEIAARLFVSRHTVNAHTKAIYGKLGVASRGAAARRAREHGLA